VIIQKLNTSSVAVLVKTLLEIVEGIKRFGIVIGFDELHQSRVVSLGVSSMGGHA
jgi:hypothetical protein